MPTGLDHVAALGVSPAGLLLVVDGRGCLLLSTDWVSASSPSWTRPLAPKLAPGPLPSSLSRPLLSCSQAKLWLAGPLSSRLLLGPSRLSCHSWAPLPLVPGQGKIERLWGGEREAYSGRLLLSTGPSSLLWTNIHDKKLRPLALPHGEELLHLALLPGALWLLTKTGRIYIRNSKAATGWSPLPLGQLGSSRLVSLSLGSEQAWGLDSSQSSRGAWLRLGSLQPLPASPCGAPAWLRLEGEVTTRLVQVASCREGARVWARDSEGGVWVREGVYPELPCGTGWVAVGGLEAAWLEVSRSSVWVLGKEGVIYRRLGLHHTDWVGDRWQQVPGPAGQVALSTLKLSYSSFLSYIGVL